VCVEGEADMREFPAVCLQEGVETGEIVPRSAASAIIVKADRSEVCKAGGNRVG